MGPIDESAVFPDQCCSIESIKDFASIKPFLKTVWLFSRSTALVLAATGLLVACGDDSGGDLDVPPHALARVGDSLVTKRQVHDFLPPADDSAEARRLATARLILLEWLEQEGRHEGLDSGTAQTALQQQDASTPATRSKAAFLWLSTALLDRVSGPPASALDVARHYRAHRRGFAELEVRSMRLVAARSRADAVAARLALERGRAWEDVIERYSARDPRLRLGSGDMGAFPEELPADLDEAVFAARLRVFYGPVKAGGAWYAFQVTSIHPLPPRSLAEARDAVVEDLEARRRERGRRLLERRLLSRYRPSTICGAGVRLPHCRNMPAEDDSVLGL